MVNEAASVLLMILLGVFILHVINGTAGDWLKGFVSVQGITVINGPGGTVGTGTTIPASQPQQTGTQQLQVN